MTLQWENYGELADALEAKYPKEDLINLDQARLVELVKSLDGFDDEASPKDKGLIKAVHYAWMGLNE